MYSAPGIRVVRTQYTGDGAADHWVNFGLVPKFIMFCCATAGGTLDLWCFDNAGNCFSVIVDTAGDHAGMTNGALVNVGSTNGIANGIWGHGDLNILARVVTAYAYG